MIHLLSRILCQEALVPDEIVNSCDKWCTLGDSVADQEEDVGHHVDLVDVHGQLILFHVFLDLIDAPLDENIFVIMWPFQSTLINHFKIVLLGVHITVQEAISVYVKEFEFFSSVVVLEFLHVEVDCLGENVDPLVDQFLILLNKLGSTFLGQ